MSLPDQEVDHLYSLPPPVQNSHFKQIHTISHQDFFPTRSDVKWLEALEEEEEDDEEPIVLTGSNAVMAVEEDNE